MIGGKHIANFFTGQFFFEPPDKEYFIRQAEEFGFDKADYLAALSRVPVFSENQVKTMMDFLARLAGFFGEMGLGEKSLKEANVKLHNQLDQFEVQKKNLEEKTLALQGAMEELEKERCKARESEQYLLNIIDFSPDATLAIDDKKKVIIWNRAIEEMTGIPARDMIGKGDYAYTVPFYGIARRSYGSIWEPENEIAANTCSQERGRQPCY
jgi:PAS domain-containing protein